LTLGLGVVVSEPFVVLGKIAMPSDVGEYKVEGGSGEIEKWAEGRGTEVWARLSRAAHQARKSDARVLRAHCSRPARDVRGGRAPARGGEEDGVEAAATRASASAS